MLWIFYLFVTGLQADGVACYDGLSCLRQSKIYVLLFLTLMVQGCRYLPLKKLKEGDKLIPQIPLSRLTRPRPFHLTFLETILLLKCSQERPNLIFFTLCWPPDSTLLMLSLFVLYINWYLNFLKMLILLTIQCLYALCSSKGWSPQIYSSYSFERLLILSRVSF
jgi:hypothetical protein